jgi:glycosyltransferase involved in cell wall biosynthesis
MQLDRALVAKCAPTVGSACGRHLFAGDPLSLAMSVTKSAGRAAKPYVPNLARSVRTRSRERLVTRRPTPALCMVLHKGYPPDPRVARAIRVARNEGFDVDLVAMRRPGEPPFEVVEGARIFRLPLSHRHGASFAESVREYVGFATLASFQVARLFLRRRYEVIHVHNPPDFLIVAALLPKLFGSRVIFDIHDLAPDMFAMRFADRHGAVLADRLLMLVERAATAVADSVITVHEPYRRELIKRRVPEEKTIVVMNSVDEEILPGESIKSTQANGFRVVYHGTLSPHYGVDLLVEAGAHVANQIPDFHIELYGSGDLLPALERRSAELGLSEMLRIEGVLPQREVLRQIQGASVGVVPNLPTRLNRFALSSKLLEYVALKIPVVAARLPTLCEYFSDEEVLFFRPGDAAALADALAAVADDADAAAARSAAALHRYEDYRWNIYAPQYAAILHSLASGA